MKTRYLALVLILVSAGLVFAEPVDTPTTYELLNSAYNRGELSYTDYVIYTVYMVHEPARIPAIYQGARSDLPSGTPFLLNAFQGLRDGIFTEAEASDISRYFGRPTEASDETAVRGYGVDDQYIFHWDTPGGNFRVWWAENGFDGIPDYVKQDNNGNGIYDYIEVLGNAMEEVLAMNDQLGWDTPPKDGDWYPDGADYGYIDGDSEDDWTRWDVYVRDVGEAMAYAQAEYYLDDTVEVDAAGHMAFQWKWAFDLVGDDYVLDENELKSTAAHEFNHITQFGVAVDEPSHFMEKTSVFFEEINYPEFNIYQGSRISAFMAAPHVGLTRNEGLSWYNSTIWAHYLESLYRQDDLDSSMKDLVDSYDQQNSVIMAWEDYCQGAASRDLTYNEGMELIFQDAYGDTHDFPESYGAAGWAFNVFNRWLWFTGGRASHRVGYANNLGYHFFDDLQSGEQNPRAFAQVNDIEPEGTREWTGTQVMNNDYIRQEIHYDDADNIYGAPDGWGSYFAHIVSLGALDPSEDDLVLAFKADPNNVEDSAYWGGNYFVMDSETTQASWQDSADDYRMHTFGDKGIIRINDASSYHEIAFSPHVLVDNGDNLDSNYQIWRDQTGDRTPPSFETADGGMISINRIPGFHTHVDFTATPNEKLFACPRFTVHLTDTDGELHTYVVNGFQPGNDSYEFNDWDEGSNIYTATWTMSSGIEGTADVTIEACDLVGNYLETTMDDFLSIADIDDNGGVVGVDADASLEVPRDALEGTSTISILVRPDITGGLLETRALSSAPTESKNFAAPAAMTRSLALSSGGAEASSTPDEELGLHVVGYAYDVSGDDELSRRATLRLRYDDTDVPNEDQLALYRWNDRDSRWEHVSAQFDRQADEVYASIGEYGVYAVGYAEMIDVPEGPAPEQRYTFALDQNFPNPFTTQQGETTINFTTESDGPVSLRVYDLSGRLVATVVDDNLAAGRHSVTWNGANDGGRAVGSGVYFYKLDTTNDSATRRLVIVR